MPLKRGSDIKKLIGSYANTGSNPSNKRPAIKQAVAISYKKAGKSKGKNK